jgi:hypothetical protein
LTRLDGQATVPGAGLMVRKEPGSDSQLLILAALRDGSREVVRRDLRGGQTQTEARSAVKFPWWVKAVRVGPKTTLFSSADGTTWETVGEMNAADSVLVGMVLASGEAQKESTAVFDQVKFTWTPPR